MDPHLDWKSRENPNSRPATVGYPKNRVAKITPQICESLKRWCWTVNAKETTMHEGTIEGSKGHWTPIIQQEDTGWIQEFDQGAITDDPRAKMSHYN
jgi:hypothetical protein